jgi:hypothetical protein
MVPEPSSMMAEPYWGMITMVDSPSCAAVFFTFQ